MTSVHHRFGFGNITTKVKQRRSIVSGTYAVLLWCDIHHRLYGRTLDPLVIACRQLATQVDVRNNEAALSCTLSHAVPSTPDDDKRE
jgi:hypothetical protein